MSNWNNATWNKQIASIRFEVHKNYYGCWEVRSLPLVESFYVNGNRIKAQAIKEYLEGLPLIELDGLLRAKCPARFVPYLEGNEAA